MDSPIRKALKRNDYLRHKLFRKIKRRQRNKIELDSKIAEKELKRRLRRPKFDGGKKAGIDVTYRDAADAYDYLNSHPDASVVLDEQSVVGHAPNARQRLAKYLENAPARYIDRVMLGYLAAGIAPVAMQAAAPAAIAASDAIGGSAAGQVATKALTSPIGKSIIYGTAGATGADIAAKSATGKTFEEWGEQDLGLPWYLSGFVNPGSYLMPVQGISSRYLNSLGRNTLNVLNLSLNGFNLKLPYTLKGYYRRAKNYLFPKKHDLERALGNMEDYTRKAMDKERKAATIAMSLNEKKPFLFVGEGEHNVLPGGFTQQNRPISVTIDGLPIYGTVSEYSYGPGHVVFTPAFGKPLSPTTTHYISFDSPKVPIEFISRQIPGELKRFLVTNNPEFNLAIALNISKLESESGAPVVGSSRLISEGLFGGPPGDVEIIVPRSQLLKVSDRLNFNLYRRTANDTGWTGSTEKALTGSEPNNLDINILGDNGTIIHQIESTRSPNKMPKEYSALAKSQLSITDNRAIKKSVELNIPKDDGSGFYTADEYFDMIKKDPELLTQSVVDNAFKSNKDKHVGRAFVMMNSDNPGTIKKVSTAIDHMAAQVPGMKRFSLIYKSQSFDNVEKNKQILLKIGFAPMDADKFASNPELMKNIIDYWYIRKTVGTRSVNFEPSPSGDSYENVMSAVRTYGNGDSAGGGGNTILGGTYGGFTRNHTSYSAYKPLVDENSATFDDVFAAFEREKNIWRQTDVVNNAIKETLQEMPGFSKIDINSIINNNSYRGQDTFTSRVSELVDSGKITHELANSFVKRVAEKLGVSGLRGDLYGRLGDYFGSMQTPQNVAYRNIDSELHNAPILPAEFGSDDMFFLNNKYLNVEYPNPNVVSRVGKMSTEDAIKLYPENVIDMRPYHQLAEAMLHAKNIGLHGKPLYDNEILAKVSGLKQARENRIDMENTYRARTWKLRQKFDDYRGFTRRRKENLKGAAITTGLFGTIGGAISYLYHDAKKRDAAYKYYVDNDKVIDQKIKKLVGLDTNNRENWNEEDFNKFWDFILQEYKSQSTNAEEKHNFGKDVRIKLPKRRGNQFEGGKDESLKYVANVSDLDVRWNPETGYMEYNGKEYPVGMDEVVVTAPRRKFSWQDYYRPIWDNQNAKNSGFDAASTESLIKLLDPSGISNWKDVGNAFSDFVNDPDFTTGTNLAFSTLGAIPYVGKYGKVLLGANKVLRIPRGLYKTLFKTPKLKLDKSLSNLHQIFPVGIPKSSDISNYIASFGRLYNTDIPVYTELRYSAGSPNNNIYGFINPIDNKYTGSYKYYDDPKQENKRSNTYSGKNSGDIDILRQYLYGDVMRLSKNKRHIKIGDYEFPDNQYDVKFLPVDTLKLGNKSKAEIENAILNNKVIPISTDELEKGLPFATNHTLVDGGRMSLKPYKNGNRYYADIIDEWGLTGNGGILGIDFGKLSDIKAKRFGGGPMTLKQDSIPILFNDELLDDPRDEDWFLHLIKEKGGGYQNEGYNSGKDIHIKPSRRGTFTAAAKKHGMSVQAYARKILKAPKGKYSSAMRKKANFARNAAKFKH